MLAIGSDHAGYELKCEVKKFLDGLGVEYIDCGCNGERADYPDIAEKTCEKIKSGECDKGILICGTGIGISISANKIKGIRAALCQDYYTAKYTRLHNDANVLGETSGHYQYVSSLDIDCDNDTILAKVRQIGAACHTGNRSCFYRNLYLRDL